MPQCWELHFHIFNSLFQLYSDTQPQLHKTFLSWLRWKGNLLVRDSYQNQTIPTKEHLDLTGTYAKLTQRQEFEDLHFSFKNMLFIEASEHNTIQKNQHGLDNKKSSPPNPIFYCNTDNSLKNTLSVVANVNSISRHLNLNENILDTVHATNDNNLHITEC